LLNLLVQLNGRERQSQARLRFSPVRAANA
jgi:hypothetical protein